MTAKHRTFNPEVISEGSTVTFVCPDAMGQLGQAGPPRKIRVPFSQTLTSLSWFKVSMAWLIGQLGSTVKQFRKNMPAFCVGHPIAQALVEQPERTGALPQPV